MKHVKLCWLLRHVDDVDVFVGAMLEDHIPGGIVGPTFACMLAHQFKNLKVADRFWFERCGEKTSFSIGKLKVTTPERLQKITKKN